MIERRAAESHKPCLDMFNVYELLVLTFLILNMFNVYELLIAGLFKNGS
jgi:hypothetical protein